MVGMEKEIYEIENLMKQVPKRPLDNHNIRSKKEIEREEYMHQEALKLGINLDMTNDVVESEDFDKVQALICLMEGRDVPIELRKRILDKKEQEKAIQNNITE